jgi:hypothetical protein
LKQPPQRGCIEADDLALASAYGYVVPTHAAATAGNIINQ